MSNVLYISYDGMTDPLGQSQVIPYLIGLSKLHTIHILSCEKKEAFGKNEQLILNLLVKNNIHWHPIVYHRFPPVFSTIYDIYRLNSHAKNLHNKNAFDIIHCRSYIAALVGLKMKRKFGTKFLFDMRGFWADERVDGKLWNLKNPIYKWVYRFFKNKEKAFFQSADYIISLTHNGESIISSGQLGYLVKTPIKVIPCCVDLELFSSLQKKEKGKDFVLSYIGSIGTWYMLDEMLDFFKVLLEQKENAIFHFITREPKELILEKCKEKKINDTSIIINAAKRTEVPKYIAKSDASIFFIKPVFSKKASSPTKQGEIMAMGVPIVCNTLVGDTDYVINKYDSGILITSFDKAAYSKAVDQLLNTKFEISDIKRGASEFYSLELGVKKYIEVYQLLTTELS